MWSVYITRFLSVWGTRCNTIPIKTLISFFTEIRKTILNSFAEEHKKDQLAESTLTRNDVGSIAIAHFKILSDTAE